MHMSKAIVSSLVIGVLSFSAAAQPGPGEGDGGNGAGRRGQQREPGQQGRQRGQERTPLSAEKASAAWAAQAAGVAESLKLDTAHAAALAKAYSEARQSHAAAAETLRQEMRAEREAGGGNPEGERPDRAGGPGPGGAKMRELMTAERAKFEKSLSGVGLTAEQTTKVMATLGTFNRQWDVLTDTITGFNLDAGKQAAATTALRDFVEATAGVRAGAAAPEGGDREAARSSMQAARKTLNDSLAGILSEEQVKTFQAAFGGPGRGGRPPEGAGGGGGEGGGRGQRQRSGRED